MKTTLPIVLLLSFAFGNFVSFSQDIAADVPFVAVPDLLDGTNPPHFLIARSAPAPGETFTDNHFGQKLACVTERNNIRSRHEYARFDPFSSDGSKIILDPDTRWRIYGTNSYPYNSSGNLIATIDLEEPRWDPQDPGVIWGLYDFSIRTVNVSTQETTVIKDFSQDPVLGPIIAQENVFRITTRDEGESSKDKRYWALFLQGDDVVDYVERYIFTWDRELDTIIGLYEVQPNEVDVDWVGMSPLGNWVIIGGDPGNGGNLDGMVVANRELTQFRGLGNIGHSDVALTLDDKEVVVGQNTATDNIDLIPLDPAYARMELVRLYYDSASQFGLQSGAHVSCNTDGFCVISTYIEPGLPEKNWLDRSIILVKLDRQNPAGYYLAKVYGTTDAYYEETHATISNDGKSVVWASNWSMNVGQEDLFMMRLEMPSNWKQSLVGADEPKSEVPGSFRLMQNAPNPFNPTTTIRYSVSRNGPATIRVFDLLGNEVSEVVSGDHLAGDYQVEFGASSRVGSGSLSSGVYLYQLRTNEFLETKKMVLLK
ncbi:MAG: T9SS type A sorting domain-containing protein [Rhodothermales bacterium]|nr:T9SS type A sorting domain-containing protein [Rhodothermales bacterium]